MALPVFSTNTILHHMQVIRTLLTQLCFLPWSDFMLTLGSSLNEKGMKGYTIKKIKGFRYLINDSVLSQKVVLVKIYKESWNYIKGWNWMQEQILNWLVG